MALPAVSAELRGLMPEGGGSQHLTLLSFQNSKMVRILLLKQNTSSDSRKDVCDVI